MDGITRENRSKILYLNYKGRICEQMPHEVAERVKELATELATGIH